MVLETESCTKETNDVNTCKEDCIRPKGCLINQVKNVVISVERTDKLKNEIYPPSRGTIALIDKIMFFKKRRVKRKREVVGFVPTTATVVQIPKKKKGWTCFSLKINRIKAIKYSIFTSMLGTYNIKLKEGEKEYLIKIGKGGQFHIAKKLRDFINTVKIEAEVRADKPKEKQ
jgi:hypothetical protein